MQRLYKNVIVQAGHLGLLTFGRPRPTKNTVRTFHAGLGLTYPWRYQLKTKFKVMADMGATEKREPITNLFLENKEDGGLAIASGGWKSEDGKLSCGYSSFRGKRVTMEDFYDIKTSNIDGQTVCMFGIFDGHGGSRAAEYLKEHLFDNLMKHPQFMKDVKSTITETYRQTDKDFLDLERDGFRDDGSTASTAVLVGRHLYVANVGDSRTVISKAGKDCTEVESQQNLQETTYTRAILLK